MDRQTKLGIVAAALMAAPVPALAQTWPAAAVATTGSRALAPETRVLAAAVEAPAWREPPREIATWIAPSAPLPTTVKTSPVEAAAPLPEVKIPAKAAWTDDQGFRLHYAEVIYKQRF